MYSNYSLSKFESLILNAKFKAHVRVKHVKRTFLGVPYTECKSDLTGTYNEHLCTEELLKENLCLKCECYPSYVTNWRYTPRHDGLAQLAETCKLVLWSTLQNLLFMSIFIGLVTFRNMLYVRQQLFQTSHGMTTTIVRQRVRNTTINNHLYRFI